MTIKKTTTTKNYRRGIFGILPFFSICFIAFFKCMCIRVTGSGPNPWIKFYIPPLECSLYLIHSRHPNIYTVHIIRTLFCLIYIFLRIRNRDKSKNQIRLIKKIKFKKCWMLIMHAILFIAKKTSFFILHKI